MPTFIINPYGAGCACARAECTDDCSVYKRYKPEPKPITHGDQLRAMSDEELAEFISGVEAEAIRRAGLFITVGDIQRGKEGWLDWLRREAGRDGRAD